MNIINIENNNLSCDTCDNIVIKKKSSKYKIDLLKKDKLNIVLNGDLNLSINAYCDFNILLYGNIYNYINIDVNVYNNSEVSIIKVIKNKEVLENINVNLIGDESKINYDNVYLGNTISNTNVNHKNSNTKSNIVNHSLCRKSDMTFNIIETVENKTQDCILNQTTKILKIDDSKAIVKPILNTRDYTVVANHSSVITNINEEDLLYLMSRGINKDCATNLIIDGFLFGNLNIKNEEIKEIKKYLNI